MIDDKWGDMIKNDKCDNLWEFLKINDNYDNK